MMLPKAWRKYSNPTKSKSPGLVSNRDDATPEETPEETPEATPEEELNVTSDPSVIMQVALARQRWPKLGFRTIRSPSSRSPNNICVDRWHTAQSV